MTPEAQDRWLGKPEVARIYGCTPRSLDNWVRLGRLPVPDRLPNGRPAWRESVIFAAVKPAESVA